MSEMLPKSDKHSFEPTYVTITNQLYGLGQDTLVLSLSVYKIKIVQTSSNNI